MFYTDGRTLKTWIIFHLYHSNNYLGKLVKISVIESNPNTKHTHLCATDRPKDVIDKPIMFLIMSFPMSRWVPIDIIGCRSWVEWSPFRMRCLWRIFLGTYLRNNVWRIYWTGLTGNFFTMRRSMMMEKKIMKHLIALRSDHFPSGGLWDHFCDRTYYIVMVASMALTCEKVWLYTFGIGSVLSKELHWFDSWRGRWHNRNLTLDTIAGSII